MATMTMVRVTYSSFADMVMGQIGEPGLAWIVSSTDDLQLYVRRDDPARPLGFDLEDPRESFDRHKEWFTEHFGADFVGQLAALFEKVEDVELSEDMTDEELHEALGSDSAVARFEMEVSELDGPQSWAKEAYEAWERDTTVCHQFK